MLQDLSIPPSLKQFFDILLKPSHVLGFIKIHQEDGKDNDPDAKMDSSGAGPSSSKGRNGRFGMKCPTREKSRILLWKKSAVLRYCFQEGTVSKQGEIRSLIKDAWEAWDSSAPVKLEESDEPWDFKITVEPSSGLIESFARSFFPNSNQKELIIYDCMFNLPRHQQVNVMAHEMGHIFGLRHPWASEEKESHKHYGFNTNKTVMSDSLDIAPTVDDKKDLADLYEKVWKGNMEDIEDVPIELIDPYSSNRVDPRSIADQS
ncbi:hypothetical protein FBU30_004682 [Linnemannia zychae]|nr:hypothetical protein FBU30_004682 [Linnemannia zychae]